MPCAGWRMGLQTLAHTADKGVCMQDKNAAELAWEMFERTGNFTYYMLYKRLMFDGKG